MTDTPIRVLFVDDEPNVLAGLRRMLRGRRREWDMQFAGSGAEAVELMRNASFDVVVSDMRMPGMDGAELLSVVQKEWPDTVRLVLSGQSDEELTLRAVSPAHQYLSKPCNADNLYRTIARTCIVRQKLGQPTVRCLASRMGWLPSLPDTYTTLVAEMNSPNACIESAARIIAQDIGMSAKVLQLINSSFFGLPVHVESVEHAAALLGLNTLKPLVLSSQVFEQFEDRDLGGFSQQAFVDHSLSVAWAARRVATLEEAPATLVDNTLLAGLLHDVGQVLLAQNLPEEYAEVRRAVGAGEGVLNELEEQAFGVTHAEIGGYLLSLWGLPSELVEAVTLHHEPLAATNEAFSPLTAVHVAETFVIGENESVDEASLIDEEYLTAIGCDGRIEDWRAAWDFPATEGAAAGTTG